MVVMALFSELFFVTYFNVFASCHRNGKHLLSLETLPSKVDQCNVITNCVLIEFTVIGNRESCKGVWTERTPIAFYVNCHNRFMRQS